MTGLSKRTRISGRPALVSEIIMFYEENGPSTYEIFISLVTTDFVCMFYICNIFFHDRLCGVVVRVPGRRYRGPGSIPGVTRFFLRSSGSTQPREDN
jgi:hypothetical protein